MLRYIYRTFAIISVIVLLFSMTAYAAVTKETIVATFDDGSYITESIKVSINRASGSKTGTKTRNYYDGNGNLDWKAVLTGSFSYTGTSATCTGASCNVTVYDSAWYTISKTAGKSGYTATASVTMGEKLLGVTVTQIPTTISLKCDANGNLS